MSEEQPPGKVISREEWDAFAVELRADGLVQVLIEPEMEVTVDHVKQIIEAIGRISGGKTVPVLVLAGEYTLPSAEARDFIASPGNPYALAEAYVVSSLPQKIVGNFYLQFNTPGRPTKIFTDPEEATRWLKEFIR
jgi:hypothetical protein